MIQHAYRTSPDATNIIKTEIAKDGRKRLKSDAGTHSGKQSAINPDRQTKAPIH